MGTRLYPMTTDVAKLETLAGVPAGTQAKVDAIKAKHDGKGPSNFDMLDELYADGNEHENTLYHFVLSGWGKFLVVAHSRLLPST